ncbi:MAG: PDZ domain-containing protein [Flavobacteriales bacterium]|nr:PDZ domain-containing protein [Flavobacteriales bacterium]
MNEPLKGNFEGVGIQFNIIRDTIYVVDAISGGPSERLGIRAGDRILTIDTENAAGVGFKNSDVMKRLRGKKGTKVTVTMGRRGEPAPLEFVITRDKIPIFSVDAGYMATPTVGYIKVSRFSATTMKEFREKMDELKAMGMQDLILDLQGVAAICAPPSTWRMSSSARRNWWCTPKDALRRGRTPTPPRKAASRKVSWWCWWMKAAPARARS